MLEQIATIIFMFCKANALPTSADYKERQFACYEAMTNCTVDKDGNAKLETLTQCKVDYLKKKTK